MFDKDFGRWVKKDLFGGKGNVTVIDLLGQHKAKPFEAVLGCELEPGGSVGAHHQQSADEIVLCLEGAGEAKVGEVATALVPGAIAYVPQGALLSLRNDSADKPLRYLIVKAK
jgi:quercetin dioxygenase-like cupin family protein